MERLRKIEIDAPPDFSRNIDLYMSGEKKKDALTSDKHFVQAGFRALMLDLVN